MNRYILCIWLAFRIGIVQWHTKSIAFLFFLGAIPPAYKAKSWSSICLLFVRESVRTACDLHCNRSDAGRTELEAREQEKQPQYHFAKIVLHVRIGAAMCNWCWTCARTIEKLSHCLDKTKTSGEIKYNWYTNRNKVKENERNVNSVVSSIERMQQRRQQLSQYVVCGKKSAATAVQSETSGKQRNEHAHCWVTISFLPFMQFEQTHEYGMETGLN